MQKIKPFLKKGLAASLLLPSIVAKAEQPINDPAPGWDHVWDTVIIDITVMGILFALLTVYFVIKYRRREDNQEGNPPKLTAATAAGWALIPAFIFMADDFYLAAKGWQLWNDYRQVPADRMEIQLESGMYSWDYTYPNGVQSQNELRVPVGKPIMLRMTSRDVVHSHYIHEFRVKEDSMPGRVTYMWFYPKEAGEYIVSCNEYCGIMHSLMTGKVIAMPEGEFNEWYEKAASQLAVADTSAVATPEPAPVTPEEPAVAPEAKATPPAEVATQPEESSASAPVDNANAVATPEPAPVTPEEPAVAPEAEATPPAEVATQPEESSASAPADNANETVAPAPTESTPESEGSATPTPESSETPATTEN